MTLHNVISWTAAGCLCLAGMVAPPQAFAQCPGSSFRSEMVTYFETTLTGTSKDTRCNYIMLHGKKVCQINMRGVLHYPFYVNKNGKPPYQYPAIVYNHGSEHTFDAHTKGCSVAEYFVPKGFVVFLPFRRGQGDAANPDDLSTGRYIEDEVAQCPANDSSCNRIEVFRKQTKEDVIDGFNYLKNRADVKPDAIAIMGVSYGGRVTVLANDEQYNVSHRAVVAFSAAAEGWGTATNPTPISAALIEAAKHAKQPAFYLQAKWDFDTRPSIDLANAHAYGGPDDKHGKLYMASTYEYPKPPMDPSTNTLDFQSVHSGFARDADRWGPAVLDFLNRNGVK